MLVHALRPRVGIMNDGTRKGGEPEVMQTVHSSPGLEDLWQLHFSLLSGKSTPCRECLSPIQSMTSRPRFRSRRWLPSARSRCAATARSQWGGLLIKLSGHSFLLRKLSASSL